MRSPIDVRDTTALSAALSQVYLLVEKTNAQAFHAAWRAAARRPTNPSAQLPLKTSHHPGITRAERKEKLPQIPTFSTLVRNAGSKATRSGWGWGQYSTIPALLRHADFLPEIIPEVINAAVALLSGLDLRLPTSTEVLWETIHEYPGLGGSAFTTLLFDPGTEGLRSAPSGHEVSVHYYEEPCDPIAAVQLFVEKVLKQHGRAVDHYVQLWLRSAFGLVFDKSTKYSLANVSEHFNCLFYGSPIPSSQEIHTRRPATMSTSLLVAKILQVIHPELQDHSWQQLEAEPLRQALGFYLCVRFCRQLRCRYYWRAGQEPDREAGGRMVECQSVTALRPLAYTYFQARIFGRISAVPGLSNIFRGGLLPRTSKGSTVALLGPPGVGKTVLALQLMADVARFGGLAIYCSIEESNDTITDRLVTFGQYQSDQFDVVEVGLDQGALAHKLRERDPLKGMLVLLNLGGDEPRSLAETIAALAGATGGFTGERSLAIDSVSALGLREPEGANQPFYRRVNLHALIDAIEASRFIGLLLGEEGDANSNTLAYLVDTVLRFSFDQETHMRFIEISKCRLQDYQSGRHPLRIVDGKGLVIYPSLVSRRSSLRRRVKTTLSEHRLIPFPETWRQDLALAGIHEKASSLIWGPPGGKTLLLLHLLTAPSLQSEEMREARDLAGWQSALTLAPPRNVLLVTFRTTEINFFQALRHVPVLHQGWENISRRRMRWYSPGENITADQLVTELWKYIKQSRREGVPVERIAFDETETAEEFLPTLQREPLFWPTLLEMTSTEAATTFFVFGGEDPQSRLLTVLRSSVDYALHTRRGDDPSSSRTVEVEKQPSLEFKRHQAAFEVADGGTVS